MQKIKKKKKQYLYFCTSFISDIHYIFSDNKIWKFQQWLLNKNLNRILKKIFNWN